MTKKNKKSPNVLSSPKNKSQYIKQVKKGQFLYKQQNYVEALKYLTKSWDFDASNQAVIKIVAECLFQIGNKSIAIQLLAHSLENNPNDPTIVSILGNASLRMDLFDLAQKFHQIYIQLKPDDPIGYNNYATALREDGKLDEAITFLQDIVPLFPKEEILWNTLGSTVAFRDGGGASIVFYEECLKLNPKNVLALNNIAPSYASIGDLESAESTIRKAIKLNPTLNRLHLFLSSLLLDTKRLKEGWEEYNWRKGTDNTYDTLAYNKIPNWQGENLSGKKIFIYGEQGIGDEILFAWLYNDIIEEADKVGLACENRLVPLFKNSFKKAQVSHYSYQLVKKLDFELKVFPDFDLTEFDYQCAAGDVPKYRCTHYEDLKPSSEAIMLPNEDKITYWGKKIADLPHDISIGIAWRSGIKHAKRARNYTNLLNWTPLLKQKNINFINIQYGDCTEELDELEKETGIKIHNFEELDLTDDFDGTTALMKNLDLVIGPGSAPLMQSSMAGVETWFILNGYPWWRFGDNTPIWRQNATIHSKNDNSPWPEHMEECSIKFKKWLKAYKKKIKK